MKHISALGSDRKFIKLVPIAEAVGALSKDPTSKVGCLILDARGCIRAVGYNGFPRGVHDTPERYADRATKLNLVAHAELNAIANAAAVGTPLAGCSLLVTKFPCNQGCAQSIINAGIIHVIAPPPDPSGSWYEANQWALKMFHEAGVEVLCYTA